MADQPVGDALTLLRLEHLSVRYGSQTALHDIHADIGQGALVALAGGNGAGKTTLLKTIAGQLRPSAGRVLIRPGTLLAYLPQAADIPRDFPLNLETLVAMGLWRRSGNTRAIGADARASVRAALAEVGLETHARMPLSALSSGQFQRALFARMLLEKADLLLLDEPFAFVDADTTPLLLAIIARWHAEGRTILCALHDADIIRRHFPQCLLLARECIGWGNSADILKEAV